MRIAKRPPRSAVVRGTVERGKGAAWGLEFCRQDDFPLSGSVVTHVVQELLAEAGVPKVWTHDCGTGQRPTWWLQAFRCGWCGPARAQLDGDHYARLHR